MASCCARARTVSLAISESVRPLPMASLEVQLRDIIKNRNDKTLYLKADQSLAYGFVVETMDRLRRAGIERLGMLTEPLPRGR